MTKDIDLDALQALAEKAGGDEWFSIHHGVSTDEDGRENVCRVAGTLGKYEWEESIRDYIAAANPQTVSWMIARIRELEGDTGKSAEAPPEWVNCESRGTIVRNSLKHQFEDLRGRAAKCRKAYNKDFMRVPFEFIADAYDRAADVIEASYRAAAKTATPEGGKP